ncbi:MAG: phage N-6-adenine-methyltransferase, partial [Armatimonadetes bacterium]|nr:phage N-6-adenine-methyltransferase [Armatimonadota bacterium]
LDALAQNWHGHVFCNPPYTKLLTWVLKAFEEVKAGRCEKAVLLLPAHTSTEWFHDYALPHGEIYWIRGKRKFGGQKKSALMPSVAICFRDLEEPA